jgi:hypothetical protein
MKAFIAKIASRKLWATISTCAGLYAVEGKASLWKIVAVVASYIVAQGAVDVSSNLRSAKPE